MTAVQAKDIEDARTNKENLQNIADTLQQNYTLRIVSGLNATSGVWRIPDNNPNARNYYIIVEPVSPTGKILSLDVVNEENNKRVNTSKFGVRVSPETFKNITQDKRDDGIIQNNIIGQKQRGKIDVDYIMPVLDGVITTW